MVESLLDLVRHNAGVWSLVVVFMAAAIEYFVPPFPGDAIVLASSLLVVTGAWPFAAVLGAAVAGGFVGSAGHYVLGRFMRNPDGSVRGQVWVERLSGKGSLERFASLFQRYGGWVIALNRMFPGVRAVAFIAAGVSGLPPGKTLALGLVSNLAWSLGMLSLGVGIGGNLETIEKWFGVYKWAAAGLGVVFVAIVLAIRLIRRKRRQHAASLAAKASAVGAVAPNDDSGTAGGAGPN